MSTNDYDFLEPPPSPALTPFTSAPGEKMDAASETKDDTKDATYRIAIENLYKKYQPAKLKDMDEIMITFNGMFKKTIHYKFWHKIGKNFFFIFFILRFFCLYACR